MITYIWQDKQTGKKLEVQRRMKDSNLPPTPTEISENTDMTEEEKTKAKWSKIITGGLGHVGFGLKGQW